jgi:hypothetical protein
MIISAYLFDGGTPEEPDAIECLRVVQRDGSVRWKVKSSAGFVLDNALRWRFEPQPSSRTDKFLASTRFSSAEEAHAAWKRYEEWKNAPGRTG